MIASIVTTNGINWFQPLANISLKIEILASLYPVTINIAAKEAKGIKFIRELKSKMARKTQVCFACLQTYRLLVYIVLVTFWGLPICFSKQK